MNINPKTIYKLKNDNLPKSTISIISDKLNIPKNSSKSLIINTFNKINPCSLPLLSDTHIKLKPHQLKVCNHLVSHRGLIVVHSVGTGKTLTAISTSRCLLLKKLIKKVIVVTPTSLQDNFKKQMNDYGVSNDIINQYYSFYTIQGLANNIDNNKEENPKDALLIIDEAHNLRTLDGERSKLILKYSHKAEKVLLLTATPLINYKHDIVNLISMIDAEKPITEDYFEKLLTESNKNKQKKMELSKYLSNKFSLYIRKSNPKHPDPNFPKKIIDEIFLPMDNDYLTAYEKVERGSVGHIPDFKNKNIKVFYNGLRRASNKLEGKSPKVDWIIKLINKHKNSKMVIFSHFINMGMRPIQHYLKSKNINFNEVTGDLSIIQRKKAVDDYNSGKNNILFISKAGSEGLDLKKTNFVIIMESAWNENSIEQIIGRGVRYKSHEGLPQKDKKVIIYRLYCIKPIEFNNLNKINNNLLLEFNDKNNNNNNMMSVDLYLRNFSLIKQIELAKFLTLLDKFKIEKYN